MRHAEYSVLKVNGLRILYNKERKDGTMKKILTLFMLISSIICLSGSIAHAGEVDVLINKLVEKGVLSPSEAQIVMDDTKLRVSKDLAEQQAYSVPDWTQRIKWGGDVRFRTQGDWGKNNTRTLGSNDGIENQRIRNRIRGRFYMDAKVNDFTYASVRFAGGATNVRSTNDTTDDYWSKKYAMFDWYYIRFEAPAAIHRDFGQYFNDVKLWAGKFPIPFEYSELVWDSDTNPSGVALQYVSPDLGNKGMIPLFNIYSNTAMLWLNENQSYTNDPILWGWQAGIKTDQFGPLASILNLSSAIYNFASIQGRSPTGSALTNTRTLNSDGVGANGNTAAALLDQGYRFGFCVFDLLASIDNQKIFDYDFPHGFYGDFIHNMECKDPTLNKGFMLGGYIGKKKIKDPGDWKARAEMRYIERDSIPDFMPDSDFYGFGTYTSTVNGALGAGNNGFPVEGGTNGKGINLAFEYQLFKNTALNFEYYWMKPIKSDDRTAPWNELQIDVVTKF